MCPRSPWRPPRSPERSASRLHAARSPQGLTPLRGLRKQKIKQNVRLSAMVLPAQVQGERNLDSSCVGAHSHTCAVTRALACVRTPCAHLKAATDPNWVKKFCDRCGLLGPAKMAGCFDHCGHLLACSKPATQYFAVVYGHWKRYPHSTGPQTLLGYTLGSHGGAPLATRCPNPQKASKGN